MFFCALTMLSAVLLLSTLDARAQYLGHVSYTNITGQTTTVVKPGPGVLHAICFNNPTATEVITLFDNASAASGTKIGTITVPANPQLGCLTYNVNFNVGLTVLTATASSDLTLAWE